MKYLVLLGVLALAYALWRQQRRSPPPTHRASPPPPAAPQDMVACAHCGVHLPRDEAIAAIAASISPVATIIAVAAGRAGGFFGIPGNALGFLKHDLAGGAHAVAVDFDDFDGQLVAQRNEVGHVFHAGGV